MKTESVSASFTALLPLFQEEINAGRSFTFTPNGTSMLPFIRGGKDRVRLSPIDRVKKGDVVFYRRRPEEFVLHRVIRVRGEDLTLCGDNQFYLERGVKKEQIIARLTAIEKNGKEVRLDSLSYRTYKVLLPLRRAYLHAARALPVKIKRAFPFLYKRPPKQ